jgi:hypothetical protein
MPSTKKNVVVYSVIYVRFFDCVNHKILPAKLEFYGITVKFLILVKSYREDRYQSVTQPVSVVQFSE